MVEIGKRGNVSSDTRKLGDLKHLKREKGRNREKEGGEKREKQRGVG